MPDPHPYNLALEHEGSLRGLPCDYGSMAAVSEAGTPKCAARQNASVVPGAKMATAWSISRRARATVCALGCAGVTACGSRGAACACVWCWRVVGFACSSYAKNSQET